MDEYIGPEVDRRFEILKNASTCEKTSSPIPRSKLVVDLALIAYLKDNPNVSSSGNIDPLFKEMAINQMKLFLFSGHDTTSSTTCYILYLLSIYPKVLRSLRTEHDDVLGSDSFQAVVRISENPFPLNKLPYTTAVINESMRLFPAASTTRRGEPSFHIKDPCNGLHYPADPSTLIWLVSHACQHDPALWPHVNIFLPERWLAREGEELFPIPGAWRLFEHGPRACIEKELSMVELKIVLCLVARRFELSAAYEELNAELDRKQKRKRVRTIDGERAYQVGKAEPSGFLPCRVRDLVMEP